MAAKFPLQLTVSGLNLYSLIWNEAGKVRKSDGTFVTYATADRALYAIAMLEEGTASRFYLGDTPLDLPAGWYHLTAHSRPTVGSVPIEADEPRGSGDSLYDGSSWIASDLAVPANKLTTGYQAIVKLTRNTIAVVDHYSVTFYKDGQPITTGITVPKIHVVKDSDGTDLIATDDLDVIASLGVYKYDEAVNRVQVGEVYHVEVTATIDGAAARWITQVFRDK